MADTSIEWADAVWSRFVANIAIVDPCECWLWKAGRFSNGYGQFRVGDRKVRAHRAYYEKVVGAVPPGLILCHHCDVRHCCNPAHMFVGSHADNARDRESKGRGGRPVPYDRRGERNPCARIGRPTVDRIRAERRQGNSLAALARRYGICASQVRNIVAGRCWQ